MSSRTKKVIKSYLIRIFTTWVRMACHGSAQVEDSQSSEHVPPVEVKIEYEEIAVEDVQPTVSRKRKYNRRREMLEVPAHACQFCDFKCRFLKNIQEHCNLVHSDTDFACDKCDYKASRALLVLKSKYSKKLEFFSKKSNFLEILQF